ncbi:hypothetical protein [Cyanobium sp. Lug-B]|uniref:hypothetical protein n=1 Tax=Cyanobium sp. Lug-B TaxID=2823716 RepID=UPI0020CC5028|nr:hypothetical protein [Cyanobium sp. Lug-B]MCP9798365.1 hypothetical protein [Cyanobium sp. Lug-B]
MRRPRRQILRAAMAVVAGLGCLTAAFVLPDQPRFLPLQLALGGVGWLGLLIGTLTFLWARAACAAERALLQGREVIGRWHIDPDLWQQFVALNRSFSSNQIAVPSRIPARGLRVIASPAALLVGDQVELFNRTAVVDGRVRHWGGDWTVTQASLGGEHPCCLYLYAGIRGDGGAPSCNNLIVPVPTTAMAEAIRVRDHFLACIQLQSHASQRP